jgi:glycosyltransferase involved in cell wall biosynthesis
VKKLAIALDHPAQYLSPGFKALAEDDRAVCRVFYWETNAHGYFDPGFSSYVRWDVDLLQGYEWWAPPQGRAVARYAKLAGAIEAYEPDAVLAFGWGTRVSRFSIAWAALRGKPLFLIGDSSAQHDLGGSSRRTAMLRFLFRRAARILTTGPSNQLFYEALGVPSSKFVQSAIPIDVRAYGVIRRAPSGSDCLRVGFVGKLIPIKGVGELLDALATVGQTIPWEARIIGDGPLREQLVAQARELGLGDRIEFSGFLNQSELPAALARLDVVVIPSSEDRRVLVAAEAIAAGAAVVVSTGTGVWGRGDLIEDGVTGVVYHSGRPTELAEKLHELGDPVLRQRLAVAALSRLDGHSPRAFSDSVVAALRAEMRAAE